jgi:hypothetical protein
MRVPRVGEAQLEGFAERFGAALAEPADGLAVEKIKSGRVSGLTDEEWLAVIRNARGSPGLKERLRAEAAAARPATPKP